MSATPNQEVQPSEDGDDEAPASFPGWAGSPGWEKEVPIPIHLQPPKEGETEGQPIAPAHVRYNELTTDRGHRPFRTRTGESYVAVPVDGGVRTFPLDNPKPANFDYVDFVEYELYRKTGWPPPSQELGIVREVLRARALSAELPPQRIVELALRYAPADGNGEPGCRLDLGDDTGRCIALQKHPWGKFLVRTKAVAIPTFARKRHQLPLPTPTLVSSADCAEAVRRLWRYLHVPDEGERLLVLTWQILRLWPKAPKPLLVVVGPEGSGKSVFSKYAVAVTDPSTDERCSLPEDRRDLQHHSRTFSSIAYDNVDFIPADIGNDLAAMITGRGANARKLYSDEDEVVSTPNPLPSIIVNGIAIPSAAPDLLDRAVFVHLGPFSDDDRTTDGKLAAEWKQEHPRILGGILRLAAQVYDRLDTDHGTPGVGREFRMAEYARVGCALAKTIGLTPEAFVSAYHTNRASRQAAVGDSGWFRIIEEFIQQRFEREQVQVTGATTFSFTATDVVDWARSRPTDDGRTFFARSHVTDPAKAIGRHLEQYREVFRERGVSLTSQIRHNAHRWSAEQIVRPESGGAEGGSGGCSFLKPPP